VRRKPSKRNNKAVLQRRSSCPISPDVRKRRLNQEPPSSPSSQLSSSSEMKEKRKSAEVLIASWEVMATFSHDWVKENVLDESLDDTTKKEGVETVNVEKWIRDYFTPNNGIFSFSPISFLLFLSLSPSLISTENVVHFVADGEKMGEDGPVVISVVREFEGQPDDPKNPTKLACVRAIVTTPQVLYFYLQFNLLKLSLFFLCRGIMWL